MNPTTLSLEQLGFFWNSRLQSYIYGSNTNISIKYTETVGLSVEKIEKLAKQRVSNFKKESKNAKY